MTEVIVDTDVMSFLFKNHPIGQLYVMALRWLHITAATIWVYPVSS